MATFRVVLKKISYCEFTVEAESAAELRELLSNDSDAAHDHFSMSESHWSGGITVKEIKKEKAEA
jgi:hypothetical protein